MNEENKLISVIIPIYKVEKYLDKCIKSVVAQTFTNLEIILVNDGSPDQCETICMEWLEKDPRIVYLSKENGGQASARNMGLDIAQGEYIAFVDSDDYIEVTMYEEMYDEITRTQVDIVCCNYTNVDKYGKVAKRDLIEFHPPKYHRIYTGEEYIKKLLKVEMIPLVWDKLFTRNIIGDRRFQNGVLAEDTLFLYEILQVDTKIIFIPEAFYHYLIRDESTTAGFNEKYYVDRVKIGFLIEEEVKKRYQNIELALLTNQLRNISSFLYQMPIEFISEQNANYLYVLSMLKSKKSQIRKSELELRFKLFLMLFLVSKKGTKSLFYAFTKILYGKK